MVKRRNSTKGDVTKQELMSAASKVFDKNGFINAIITDISREAGKSTGTFYIYFKNKSEVLKALVDQFDSELLKNVALIERDSLEDLPNPLLWKERIRSIWQVYSTHRAIFFALAQAAAVSPEFHAAERRLRQRAFEDFQHLIKTQQAKGLCQDLDPAVTAIALEAMLDGFLYECLAEPGHKVHSEDEFDHAIETLINLIDVILQSRNTLTK
jgi:AcrR family transcriptional regulator